MTTRVLVTGMSGTGKSTVLAELGRRGHRVVDTDYSGWSEEVALPDGTGWQQLWREDRRGAGMIGPLLRRGRYDAPTPAG